MNTKIPELKNFIETLNQRNAEIQLSKTITAEEIINEIENEK